MNAFFGFVAEMARKFTGWLDLDFWELVLLFMLLMLVRLIAKAHTGVGGGFDVKFLLVDESTDRVSLKKLGALLALLTSTWIVLFMTVKGSMTEAILGLYLFVWAGVYVTPQTVAAWRNPQPQPTGGSNAQPNA